MPKKIENINDQLFKLLHTNGYDPTPLLSNTDDAPIPSKADLFKFVTKNGIPVTVSIDDNKVMKLYFNKNATKDPSWSEDRENLIKKLKWFVRKHALKNLDFEMQDKGQKTLKYDMAKREHMKKDLSEGYHSMGKRASYNDSIPTVKIILQHNKVMEQDDARFRNVAKIFIENVDGERILAPTRSPGIAKIYARLISEGDKPYSDRWNHVNTLVEEYTKLRGFVRATQNKQFNESATRLISESVKYFEKLRENLKSLSSKRGYRSYFDNWTQTLNEDNIDDNLTEMFKNNEIDSRVQSALPILSRLNNNIIENTSTPILKDLEEWADSIENEYIGESKSPEEFMSFITKPNPELLKNERADIHFTADDWQLYTAGEYRDKSQEVAQQLNNRFNQLVNSGKSRDEVKNEMNKLMQQYSRYGASDTEPRWVLSDLLDEYFPKKNMSESVENDESLKKKT